MKTALILIDIQNDFVPGGALAVPDGNAVVAVANELMDHVDLVVATQDWHPANHGSFVSMHPEKVVGDVVDLNGVDQVVWPDHCVAGSTGAAFVDELDVHRIGHVITKGTDPAIDSYSGFFDNDHKKETGLQVYLKQHGVKDVVLVGLATDYCVKFTALDARQLGFGVTLVSDGVRGVNLQPGDIEKAIADMRDAGVVVAKAGELKKSHMAGNGHFQHIKPQTIFETGLLYHHYANTAYPLTPGSFREYRINDATLIRKFFFGK